MYPQQGFDLRKDFAGLILVGTVQNVMTVRPGLPAATLQEVLALVKARPGAVSFASSGVGASNHLGPEMLRGRFGLDWVHVPYRGSGPATTDLIAGNVDVFFDNVPSILPHLRSGAVRPIAVLSAQRAPELPEVPTFAEAGVPGVVIESWFGLIAPARVPAGPWPASTPPSARRWPTRRCAAASPSWAWRRWAAARNRPPTTCMRRSPAGPR
ncbi:Bug family tripartite tricarboxylate transporter substrate binding protein [Pseudoroseomonas wenyumeiae]